MRRSEGRATAAAAPSMDALLFDTFSELMDIDVSQCSAPSAAYSPCVTTSSHSSSSIEDDEEEDDQEDIWERPSMNDALMDAILFQDIEALLVSHHDGDVANGIALQRPHTPSSASHMQSAEVYSPMPFAQQREDAKMVPMATVVDWLNNAGSADAVATPNPLLDHPQDECGDDVEMVDVDASEAMVASDKAYSVSTVIFPLVGGTIACVL